MAAVGNLAVRIPEVCRDEFKNNIVADFLKEVPDGSHKLGRAVKWGDWSVTWKRISGNDGRGFVGYTNNKIFGRSVNYTEPVNGLVSFLMWRHVNIAMFSTQQRFLWIQYRHDGWDCSDPLNAIMYWLYGPVTCSDRGTVTFVPTTAPSGDVICQCDICLGEKSNPPSIHTFADGRTISRSSYMDSTVVLYGIGQPDGNNIVHLKPVNNKPKRSATVQPITFIDGGDVGLW